MRILILLIFGIVQKSSGLNYEEARTVDLVGFRNDIPIKSYGHPSIYNIFEFTDKPLITSVILFPIETCQVVRMCFQDKNINTYGESWCDNSITYFSTTGMLELQTKTGTTSQVESGYTYDLHFQVNLSNDNHYINVFDQPYSRRNSMKPTKKIEIALVGKNMLIMTNSRQCNAQIIQNGVVFTQSLMPSHINLNLVKVFEYERADEKVETFFTHTGFADKNIQRKNDLLPFLKHLRTTSNRMNNIQFKCYISGYGQSNSEIISKYSVLQTQKTKNMLVNPSVVAATKEFSINVVNCHWLRLWFTKSSSWSEYSSNIDTQLDQTIDLFFHEGFMLLPDRENAIKLPGSSSQIQNIKVQYHGGGITEIWLGSVGKEYINPISFYLSILDEETLNLFLIRSPYCDANFGSKHIWNSKANLFELRKCEANSLTP